MNWAMLDAIIQASWRLPGFETAQHLVYYSKNDPMCNKDEMEKMLNHWKSDRRSFNVQMWETSAHAQHLIQHNDDYMKMFQIYLSQLNLNCNELNYNSYSLDPAY